MLKRLLVLGSLSLLACDEPVPPSRDGGARDFGSSGSRPGDLAGADLRISIPPSGYLRAQGGNLIDKNGSVVRLTGLSWFGLETPSFAPHGLNVRSMDSILDQIQSLGYNMIRVPFSNQLLDPGSNPQWIDYGKNPTLAGRKGAELIDAIVDGAALRGLKVVLDRHRPDANAQSALWYTSQYSEQRWIADWEMLAARYAHDGTVVGADLHNEPRDGATWGDGNQATDWRLAAQRAGNAILAVNPDLLIIVEGVQYVGGSGYWWGGNLRGVASAPVQLDIPDRVVYSPHDYPSSVAYQPWFGDGNYPGNLPTVWDTNWGYIAKNGIAPIWIGEFGTRYETSSDRQWMSQLASYIAQNKLSFAFWCLNPDSSDTGGILQDDWQTVISAKNAVLQPVLAPPIP